MEGLSSHEVPQLLSLDTERGQSVWSHLYQFHRYLRETMESARARLLLATEINAFLPRLEFKAQGGKHAQKKTLLKGMSRRVRDVLELKEKKK